MKKVKIIFCAILIFVLALGMIGCGTGGEQSETSSTSATAAPDTAPASDETQASSETPETSAIADKYPTLQNANLKIIYFQSMEQYEQSKIDVPDIYDYFLDAIPEFEKKYGGKIELIATDWNGMLEKCVAMQNAGDAPDLFLVSDQTFHNTVTKSVVQPLDSFTTDEDFSFWSVKRETFSWRGSTYGIPIKPYFKYILYNKTLFEENGLKTPKEYYKEGKWDFDAFAEVGKALTMDTDGDGTIDQWGFTTYQDFVPAIMIANGGAFLKVTDKSISSGLSDPNTQEAMTYLTDWLKQPGGFINFGLNIFDAFNSGKLAMAVGPEYPQPTLPFEVDLVPYPYGPSNPNKSAFVYPQAWSVPTGAKNPEGAVAFVYLMNKLTKERYWEIELKRYGEENCSILNDPNLHLVYSMDKGLSNIWFLIASVVNHMYDQLPPATIAEKINPMIESEIVKVYGEQKE